MMKLSYVQGGQSVNFTYLVAVVVEAKIRDCPLFELIQVQTGVYGDTKNFNSIIDWLIKNYPSEFCLE